MKNRARIYESLIYVLVLFFICSALQRVLIHGLRQSRQGAFGVWNDIRKGLDVEVLVSGDSRALVNFDPRVMEKEMVRSVYVLGMHALRPDLQLARLKMFLKYGQKPKLIVQVVGIETLSPGSEGEARYYFPYLDEDDLYRSLLKYSKKYWLWRYVPLFGFAENGTLLTQLAVEGLFKKDNVSADHYIQGYRPNENQWTDDFEQLRQEHPDGMRFDILEERKQQLEDIISLAQQSAIPLILVYCPEYVEAQAFFLHHDEVIAYFKDLSRRRGVSFYDYSHLPMTRTKTSFYNSQHLNRRGAEVFSNIFSRDIKKLLPL